MSIRFSFFRLSAALLGAVLCWASPANAITIDFTTLAYGSSISNEYASQGVNFAAVTSEGVSTAASISSVSWGSPHLSNAPASSNGDYPTSEFLLISFTKPVYNISFTFSNWGDNSDAVSGGSSYEAYGPKKKGLFYQLLDNGSLAEVDNDSLVKVAASGIISLIIDNGFTDTFSSDPEGSWEFGIAKLSYDLAPVPLPAALPLFGLAMAGFAGASRLRRR